MVLKFVEILDYYDVPLTLIAEDSISQKYLCHLCNWPSKENSDLQYECVTIKEKEKDYVVFDYVGIFYIKNYGNC